MRLRRRRRGDAVGGETTKATKAQQPQKAPWGDSRKRPHDWRQPQKAPWLETAAKGPMAGDSRKSPMPAGGLHSQRLRAPPPAAAPTRPTPARPLPRPVHGHGHYHGHDRPDCPDPPACRPSANASVHVHESSCCARPDPALRRPRKCGHFAGQTTRQKAGQLYRQPTACPPARYTMSADSTADRLRDRPRDKVRTPLYNTKTKTKIARAPMGVPAQCAHLRACTCAHMRDIRGTSARVSLRSTDTERQI